MLDLYTRKKVKVSTTVFSNIDGTAEYGKENNVEVGDDNIVKKYDKSRKSLSMNGVDIGYFIVDKTAINPRINSNISFEEDMLPPLIAEKQLIAYVTDRQYYYITDSESLKSFEDASAEEGFKPIPKILFNRGAMI
ncbi:MAG: hypothetical protein FP827_03490 [Candidatus Omnitrophica bacterium]|nr:hypothetical protein [Candidatus Omnitrophota bacterium]